MPIHVAIVLKEIWEASMRAHDIMTTAVVTAHPDTSVRELAKLMVDHRVSGLPVVDEANRLVGMVTDGDLYRRAELGTERRGSSWWDIFGLDSTPADDFVESHGRVARDVMTKQVVAVAPGTTLRQIAELFEARRIRRVPVVANGTVVGIISRANLVQALAVTPGEGPVVGLSDRRVRDLVIADYKRLPLGPPSEGNVIVTDGIVHLWGYRPSNAEADALRVAAEAIPGVKGFEDHTYRYFGDANIPRHAPSEVILVEPEEAD
jgi:CBS domain-containing protein